MLKTVGLIANPQSGKDIRRLVSKASIFDNEEKVNIVERILSTFNYFKIDALYYLKDSFGIVEKAQKRFRTLSFELIPVDMPLTFEENDSTTCAKLMSNLVDVIIVLGGDGTNRAVTKGLNLENPIPLLPLSTGTNNVFPEMIEATTAALSIVSFLSHKFPKEAVLRREKLLKITYNGNEEIALIDAVFTNETFIGAKAIWDIKNILAVFTTFAEISNIGFSSIPAVLMPSKRYDNFGSYAILGEGFKIVSPIAPGKIEEINIKEFGILKNETPFDFTLKKGTVALDGERKIEIFKETVFSITLTNMGPFVIDVKRALELGIQYGIFRR